MLLEAGSPSALRSSVRVRAEPATSLRDAMRQLASGVCVVTTGLAPNRSGFTATSVTSLSVSPERILVCASKSSSSLPLLQRSRRFAINVLGSQHAALADRFAGRTDSRGDDRFRDTCWHTLETGAPVLCDALAAVDCELEEAIERHSHAILIGRVVAVRAADRGEALVYWRADYESLGCTTGEAAGSQWAPII